MKEFDFEAAKQGAAVMTMHGHRAKILCFDKKGESPIVATIDFENHEQVYDYSEDGTMPAPAPSRLFLVMRDDDYKERLTQGLYCSAPNDQNEALTQSKRALFASLAMQGIISGRDAFAIGTAIPDFSKRVAKSAVIFADDLIAELNKKEGEK